MSELPPPQKTSGLKPPSKIGRLCSSNLPKPSIPGQSLQTNGASGSIRKLSDDLIKTRINEEAEENDDFSRDFFVRRGSPDRKSSNNSVVLTEDTDSFIVGDRIWVGGTKSGCIAYIGETKFAPGEWAGIVLDEPIGKNDGAVGNTRYFQCEPKKGVFSKLTRLTRSPIAVPDPPSSPSSSGRTPVPSTPLVSPPLSVKSFSSARSPPPSSVATPSSAPPGELKIGERVIVMSQQGSKAGILRFKGTTSFANGEWCGVELDDPLGKNDGTVDGVRYFTCEQKFGLFAPAHKVSRSPTKNRRPSCQVHHTATSLRRVGSKESLASSIISTASSVRTTNTTASRRTLARPLTSPMSTPKPSAQDLLKCKQDQINQLLKEKQLDRAALTNAAQQADDLEKKLGILQMDYDKLCSMMTELQVRHDIASMETAKFKAENLSLTSKIGEIQAQLEDFQFRTEEATIFESDIQVANQKNEEKIKELEQLLLIEQTRNESLFENLDNAQETTKKVEHLKMELETIKKAKEEMENTLKRELIETIERANRFEEDHERILDEFNKISSIAEADKTELMKSSIGEIGKLKATVDDLNKCNKRLENDNAEFERLKGDLSKMVEMERAEIEGLKEEIKRRQINLVEVENDKKALSSQIESYVKETDDLRTQLEAISRQFSDAKLNVDALTSQLEQTVKTSTERSKTIDNLNEQIENIQSSLKGEIKESELKYKNEQLLLKEELTSTSKKYQENVEELDRLRSSNRQFEEKISSLQNDIDGLNVNLSNKSDEILQLQNTLTAKEKEMSQLIENTSSAATEAHKIEENWRVRVEQLTFALDEQKAISSEVEKSLSTKNEEISKLEEKCKYLESTTATMKDDKARLENELEHNKQKVSENIKEISRLQLQIETNENEIAAKIDDGKTMANINRELQDQKVALENSMSKAKIQIQKMELELGNSQRQLADSTDRCQQLMSEKEKLEMDLTEMATNSSDSSEQLGKLRGELKEKSKQLDLVKTTASEAAREAKNREQELIQSLEIVQESKVQLEKDLATSKEATDELNALIRNKYKADISSLMSRLSESENCNESTKKAKDELNERVVQLEKSLETMTRRFEESNNIERNLMERIENEGIEKMSKISLLNSEISSLKTNVESLSEDKSRLVDQLKALETANEEISTQLRRANEEKTLLLVRSDDLKTSSVVELSTLKKLLDDKESANKNLLLALDEMKSKLELNEKRHQDTCELNENNERNLNELRNSLEKLKQEKENVISEKQSIFGENENLKSQNLRLSECVKTFETNELRFKEEIVSMGKRLEDMTSSLEASSKANDSLKSFLNEKTDALVKAEESARKREIETSEENRRLQEKTSELKIILDMSLVERDNEIEKIKVREKEMESNLKTKEEELDKIRSQLVLAKEEELKVKESTAQSSGALSEEVGQLKRKIRESEQIIESLKKEIDRHANETNSASVLRTELVELKDDVEVLKKLKDESANAKLNYESEVKRLVEENKMAVNEKTKAVNDLKGQQERISRLEKQLETEVSNRVADSSNLSKLRACLNTVEEEKSVLGKKLQALESEIGSLNSHRGSGESENNNGANIGEEPAPNNWEEEKEFAESQINFLNSIIVDLKTKNEGLEAQMEEYVANGGPIAKPKVKKEVAPRLFCDICDMFDLHDTEDCPTQASSDSPPPHPVRHHRAGARQFEERPYCEICEMFGHWASDCNDEETY